MRVLWIAPRRPTGCGHGETPTKALRAKGRVTGRERILLYNTGAGVLYPELLPVDAPVLDPNDPRALHAVP